MVLVDDASHERMGIAALGRLAVLILAYCRIRRREDEDAAIDAVNGSFSALVLTSGRPYGKELA